MRRWISFAALGLAWLCANGAIWNVVQVVAWARMLSDYSRVMPMREAVRLTFDGSAPCKLCIAAANGRETARDQAPVEAALGAAEKLLLAFQPGAEFVLSPPRAAWPAAANSTGSSRCEPVPLRPPRV